MFGYTVVTLEDNIAEDDENGAEMIVRGGDGDSFGEAYESNYQSIQENGYAIKCYNIRPPMKK